jgi:hypothetical protein
MKKSPLKKASLRIPLRVVFYREEDQWVAHCLEFDTLGHGKSHRAALKMLSQASAIQIEQSLKHGNFRDLFSPADSEYFAKFAAGKNIAVGEVKMRLVPKKGPIRIQRVETREFCDQDLVPA